MAVCVLLREAGKLAPEQAPVAEGRTGCGKQYASAQGSRRRLRNPTRAEAVGRTRSSATRHLPPASWGRVRGLLRNRFPHPFALRLARVKRRGEALLLVEYAGALPEARAADAGRAVAALEPALRVLADDVVDDTGPG